MKKLYMATEDLFIGDFVLSEDGFTVRKVRESDKEEQIFLKRVQKEMIKLNVKTT